jgi:hypothetical protein
MKECNTNRIRLLAVEHLLLEHEGEWVPSELIVDTLSKDYGIEVNYRPPIHQDVLTLDLFYKVEVARDPGRKFKYRLTRCNT